MDSERNQSQPDPLDTRRELDEQAVTVAVRPVVEPDPPGTDETQPEAERGRWRWGGVAVLLVVVGGFGYYSSVRERQQPIRQLTPPAEVAIQEAADPVEPNAGPSAEASSSPVAAPRQPEDPLPFDPATPDTGRALIAEAERIALEVARRFPRNPDAHEMAARFYYEFGEIDQAAAAWEKCLQLNANYAYALIGLAKVATSRGDHGEAVTFYRRAVLASPQDASPQLGLGSALLAQGEVDEAIAVLEQAIRQNPKSVAAVAELGAAQLQRRDYEAARRAFESALALNPAYTPARIGLATTLARLGHADEARAQVQRAEQSRQDRRERMRGERTNYDDDVALSEDIGRMYSEMAAVFLAEGQPSAAERLWRRSARLDPENRDCHQALAWLFLQQNKPYETIKELRELVQLDPHNLAYPTEIARLYSQLGRVQDAERALRNFVEQAPDHADGHAALAEFLLQVRRQGQEAIPHAKRAAELSNSASHWRLLSAAYEFAGQLPEAVATMELAAALTPDDPQARQLLQLLRERAAAAPSLEKKP